MPIRLTESRLRSIIREEMNALTRRKTAVAKRTLKEGLDEWGDDEDEVMYEAIDLTLVGADTAALERKLGQMMGGAAGARGVFAKRFDLDRKLLPLLALVPELAAAPGFMQQLTAASRDRGARLGVFFYKDGPSQLRISIGATGIEASAQIAALGRAAEQAGLSYELIENLDY